MSSGESVAISAPIPSPGRTVRSEFGLCAPLALDVAGNGPFAFVVAEPATVVVAVDATDAPPCLATDVVEEVLVAVIVTVVVTAPAAFDGGAADDVAVVVAEIAAALETVEGADRVAVVVEVVGSAGALLTADEDVVDEAAVAVLAAAPWATLGAEVDAARVVGLAWGRNEATPTRRSATARPPTAPAKNPPLPIPAVISEV